MALDHHSKHQLGVFSLVMIAVVSVDSLKILPISAQYGFSLISYYVIAGCFFFLPLAWITGKLAIEHPKTGGSYVWIKEAFGVKLAHLAIWLQWFYNMIWYPTIFVFITATLGSLITSHLGNSHWFILGMSLLLFWLLSLLHCRGIRTTSWISVGSAIVGTLLPMFFMIFLAIYWIASGKPSATAFHFAAIFPSLSDAKNIGFFSNILFGLMGLEVIAMHAGNVSHPQKAFPLALRISTFLILLTIVCGSLALCVIMPAEKIALISGVVDVLKVFFSNYYGMDAALIIGICIVIGGLGIASSWMVSLARGLHVALSTVNVPQWLKRANKNHMPSGVLILQAVIYSVLMSVFLLSPDLNHSYWILSAVSAQCALLYYILLFCAAIKLLRRESQQFKDKVFRVILPVIACIICFIGILVGFIPPELS